MMPAIASKTESFSRRMILRQSDRGSPPRARALHDPGQLIRKSAPGAVRTDQRNGGHAIGYRRAAENCREPLLQGGARKRRYSRCRCTDPRRLKTLARSTQELLATAPHIKHAAQLIVLPGSPANRKLDHPNDASRRSLHRLGVAHRCCTQSQDCFVRVLQSRPKAS